MTETVQSRESASNEATKQYLTFSLDGEEYGLDILKVQEIKGYVPTTRIPNSPAHVTGILNLRGSIVPLIDLRKKFGLEPLIYDQFNAIIVLNVNSRVMGILVDRVSEVLSISDTDIQPPPELGQSVGRNMVEGMAKVGDQLIILLDIDAVLAAESSIGALALAA